jgi:hypothetical protein
MGALAEARGGLGMTFALSGRPQQTPSLPRLRPPILDVFDPKPARNFSGRRLERAQVGARSNRDGWGGWLMRMRIGSEVEGRCKSAAKIESAAWL